MKADSAQPNPAHRSKARHYAMQALYQWSMTQNPLHVIESEFHSDNDMRKVDIDYFHELVHNCLLYTSPSPRDLSTSRMPSSA